jgi:hypothetical protein
MTTNNRVHALRIWVNGERDGSTRIGEPANGRTGPEGADAHCSAAAVRAVVLRAARDLRARGEPEPKHLQAALAELGVQSAEHESLGACASKSGSGESVSPSLIRIRDCMAAIVAPDRRLARAAAFDLLSQWHAHNVGVRRCVAELLKAPSEAARRLVLESARELLVQAYRNVRHPIRNEDAVAWLNAPSARFYTLVELPGLRVIVATVVPTDETFTAAWLRDNTHNHVALVNENVAEDDLSLSIFHELEHLVKFLCPEVMMRQRENDHWTVAESVGSGGDPDSERQAGSSPLTLFALAQRQVDPDDKALAAEWVATDLPLTNGAGIFVDAGSQCMEVWKAIVGQIEKSRFANLAVVTNSLLVLQDWPTSLTKIPQLQGTTIEPAGEIFDAPHLAFYGEAVKTKLTSPHFRPSAVYIGASGIEFDEEAGILLGYHAGEPERASKELLFQCPCKDFRVILATPKKVGNPGGRVFDILSVRGLDPKAPIYLVSAEPKAGSPEERQFEAAKRVLQSERMKMKLLEKGIRFHWITLDRHQREAPKVKEHVVVGESVAVDDQLDGARGAALTTSASSTKRESRGLTRTS